MHQQLVDYIRANGATYPREAIDQQLRQTGYAEADIAAAWASVGMPPAAGQLAGGAPVLGGGATTAGMSGARIALFSVIGFVVVAIAAAVLFIDPPETRTASDRQLSEDIAETLDISEGQAEAAVELLGGATVEGKLPKGWTADRDGMWIDGSSGNNVNVVSGPKQLTFEQELANLEQVAGFSLVGSPKDDRIAGRDARRIEVAFAKDGLRMQMTQWYVETDEQMAVVTQTVTEAGDNAADRKELRQVLAALRFDA